MVHSNNVPTMPAYDQKNRIHLQKTKLEKILFVFVVVLFAVVALLLYFYLIRTLKEVGIHRQEKTDDGSKICTKQSCVFNAASLMEKMDPSANPCDDFYSYACGGYDKTTPIPAHSNFIHVLKQLQDENTKYLHTVLEHQKLRIQCTKNAAVFKLLQAYDTCMDHSKFEDNALLSFKKLIGSLGDSNITSKEWNKSSYSLFDAIVKGTRLNFNFFFTTGVTVNTKNSSKHVFFIREPILIMEAKSYLPKKTTRDKKILESYKEYMIRMLKSIAVNPTDVPMAVNGILRLEKRIAQILTRFPHRDDKYISTLTIGELSRLTNFKFDWLSFFQNLAKNINYYPSNNEVILLLSKEIIKNIVAVIETTDKYTLSNFIAWKILQDSIPALPGLFTRHEHRFKNSIQIRVVEQLKRWQTCIGIVSKYFPKVLSYLYVEERFSEESRRKVSAR